MSNGKIMGIPSNWVFAAVLIVLVPFLLRLLSVFNGLFGTGESQEAEYLRKRKETEAVAIGTGVPANVLQADAKALSHALGTAYSWFDFRSWSEDEKAAIAVVAAYDPSSFLGLEAAYRIDVASSLRGDLKKYLTASQYNSLKVHMDAY